MAERGKAGRPPGSVFLFEPLKKSSSPYINRFLQPDTIVPSYANPQSLNRYSYAFNNPLRYIDPTGHKACEEYQGSCLSENQLTKKYGAQAEKRKEKSASKNEARLGRGGSITTPYPISLSYDSQVIANQYVPFTASQWGSVSLFLDRAALGVDSLAGIIVLGHVAVGAAGGLTFEGNPVTGGAGAAAGYIVGETNPIVRGLVGSGNGLASAATYAGIVQAEKTGDVRVTASLKIDQSGTDYSAHAHVSGNTLASVGLTTAGLFAQPVSISLPLQLLAVMNDEGSFPLPSFGISVGN